jgi:inner membrane transporter RhtA
MVLVVGSMVSLQFGTAIAISAFDDAGPLGVVWMRGVIGGLLLALYLRPRLRSYTAEQWRAIVPYALSLASFTVFFYLALDRAPLGVVSALEMSGPLAVAALGRRSRMDFVWIGFAGAGVLLLAVAKGVDGHIDALGVVFSLAAAAGLALYIVFGKQVGQRVDGLGGLATALLVCAVVQAPLGLADGGSDLLSASVLAACVAAGVLSTVIPFSLELIALRTLAIGVFGLLLAFEPAIAALAGYLVRDQALTPSQMAGIGLIVVAGAGVMFRPGAREVGRNATAIAVEPATLHVIGKEEFTALRDSHPRIDGKRLAVVAQRTRGR